MKQLRAILALFTAALALTSCGDDTVGTPKTGNMPPDTLGSERVLLEVAQYAGNHNGGGLAFDNHGYLYLSLGDGGGAGDPDDNAQNPTNPLGSVLRLVVKDTPPYYGIPVDNPFVDNTDGWREEIFAYGFRNPWRVSIDPQTNKLWVADVGEGSWEEIDVVESGKNYGWDCREGAHPYTGPPDGPSRECRVGNPYQDPVFEYAHESRNISITGGFVYRGAALPALVGKYVYADYGSGRIWAFDPFGPTNELLADAPFRVSSFGVDEDRELYFLEYEAPGFNATHIKRLEESGGVYTIVDAFPDVTFLAPVDLRHPGDGSGRLYVVEQAGRVVAFDTAVPDSTWTVYDVSSRLTCCGESGLLGLAFHPEFASNGYAYIYYTTISGGLVGRLSRIRIE